jgi:hypothetical protein
MRKFSLLFLIFIVGVNSQNNDFSSNLNIPSVDIERNWQSPGHCGVNAVYCLLKLHEIDCLYEDICLLAGSDISSGLSIDSLCNISKRSGLRLVVQKTVFNQSTMDLTPPYVAHLDDSQYGGKG